MIISPLVAAPPPAMCGGYSRVSVNRDVRAIATFAVKTEAKSSGETLHLNKVLQAEKQVVAGTNYRLEIKVKRPTNTQTAQVVVWHKLDGSYTLTSWTWL